MGLFNDDEFEAAASSSFFAFNNSGDTIEGEVTGVKRDQPSQTNPTWPSQDVYSVRTEAGTVFQVGAATILKDKLRQAGADTGFLVGVRYLGKKTSKNGNEYKDWAVVAKRASLFGGAQQAAPVSAVSEEQPPF